jgi:hypothetical protein
MTNIDSLQKLKNYVLKSLGHPINNIEIGDEQLTDRIGDAVERFMESHYDGVTEDVYELNVTAALQDYVLPDDIKIVLFIFPTQTLNSGGEPLLITNPYYVGNEPSYKFNLADYEFWLQGLKMTDEYFKKMVRYDYNVTSHKLKLLVPPASDATYALKVYRSETEANLKDIYNNTWLKQYCVALSGIQWAVNISKYGGAPLPGGVTLNYSEIEQRYQALKDKLEEDLDQMYSEPVDFFMG